VEKNFHPLGPLLFIVAAHPKQAIIVDIHPFHHQTERQLMDNDQNFYKTDLDNLYDGVYFVNRNCRILYWDKGARV
jgi:hypothetical protein